MWNISNQRSEIANTVLSRVYFILVQEEVCLPFIAPIPVTSTSTITLGNVFRAHLLHYGMIVFNTIAVLQQVTDTAIEMYYATIISQTSNMSKDNFLYKTIFIGLLDVIVAFVGMNLSDR
ncbi:MFS transporter [Martelella alba]|uniref:MFS transporter n=1 Tax=Martelella alba TaxID=2590451 RepID=UPI0035A2BC5F